MAIAVIAGFLGICSSIYKLVSKIKPIFSGTKIIILVTFTLLVFLSLAYISFYFDIFNEKYVNEFISAMETLLKIMLILITLLVFFYVLIGFFGRRYTLRVDNFNIGGINILFDQSNAIYIKTVGTYIGSKRTLFTIYESRDNIYQLLDVYYKTYNFIRDNLELLDPKQDKEIYDLSVDILKKINGFLTTHQNDYRRWYDQITAIDRITTGEGKDDIIVHSTTIEDVQKNYYRYSEIISGIKDVNSFMKEKQVREKFNIHRFDWEE